MSENPPIGDQQLDVFRFVSEHAPISVSEVVRLYGEPRGFARTTILTVMERLRKKGYLSRSKIDGFFVYSPRVEASDLLKDLARGFVERTLSGSLMPFVAYLAEASDVTDEELDALKRQVEELDRKREARDA